MPESWPWIVGGTLLLLWTVGAYNRLVRLRAEVVRHWSPVDAALRRRHGLAVEGLPPAAAAPAAEAPAPPQALVESLDAAAAAARQAGRVAAAIVARPLEPGALRSLSLAERVLDRRLAGLRETAAALAAGAEAHPEVALQALLHTLHQSALQVEFTRGAHDEAVARYTAAVAEWPTRVVAWLFSFPPGAALAPGVAAEPAMRPLAATAGLAGG